MLSLTQKRMSKKIFLLFLFVFPLVFGSFFVFGSAGTTSVAYAQTLDSVDGDRLASLSAQIDLLRKIIFSLQNLFSQTSSVYAQTSCPENIVSLLPGCHDMGNAYFNDIMDKYVNYGGSTVYYCSTNYISGCSTGGGLTSTSTSGGGSAPPTPGNVYGTVNPEIGGSHGFYATLYPDPNGDQVKTVFDWGDGGAFSEGSFTTPSSGGLRCLLITLGQRPVPIP